VQRKQCRTLIGWKLRQPPSQNLSHLVVHAREGGIAAQELFKRRVRPMTVEARSTRSARQEQQEEVRNEPPCSESYRANMADIPQAVG